MPKLNEIKKLEILTEIKQHVEDNGVFNEHRGNMLQVKELELADDIEKEMKDVYLKKVEKRMSEIESNDS